MSYRVQVGLLLALAGITFVLWGVHYAHIDLWWDELDSLTEYALVTFQTTVTKYPYPNNHIFFNLFDNGLTRVWGVRDIYQIMERVAFLRWHSGDPAEPLGLHLLRGSTGARVPVGAPRSLVTSLPFLNFAMQLRGYGLSMFFVAGLLFHCALRRERVSLVSALVTAVFSFALLYTVPSNVYFLFVLGLALVVREVGTLRRRRLASIRSEDATDRDANRAGGKIPG
ncbi:MAG: hypothetical protein R3E12_05135 [Candidatus Eisenbacteria bacterium]